MVPTEQTSEVVATMRSGLLGIGRGDEAITTA